MKSIVRLFGVLVLAAAFGQAEVRAQSPEMLPSIPGNYTYPVDINNQGQIVGVTYSLSTGGHAVLWNSSGVVPLGGPKYSSANAISDSGVIVGSGSDSIEQEPSPVMWVNGVATILPTMGHGGAATDINSAGEIVGWVNTAQFTSPAVWRNGILTVLPGFFGNGGTAASIDDQGRIAGISTGFGLDDQVPTQWTADIPQALPTNFGQDYIGVLGINKSGAGRTSGYQILRQTLPDVGDYFINVAIAWRDSEFRELQRPYGVGNSLAYGVNANGLYFGSTEDMDGYTIPTYWDNDGAIRLPLAAGRSASATAANESGMVVGFDRTDSFPVPLLWRMKLIEMLTMPNVEATPGQVVELKATAKKGSAPAVGRPLEFQVDGRSLGKTKTDATGTARMVYKVPVNSGNRLNVMASLGGSNYLFRSIIVGKNTVAASVTPVVGTGKATVRLQATLRTVETNKVLGGRQVSFLLRGKVVAKAITDTNGVARASYKLPANLSPGRLPLEAKFTGDLKMKPALARATFRLG